MATKEFEEAVEIFTGHSAAYLRETPIDELRREVEKKRGGILAFISRFPLIGRGNVLRRRMISHGEAEAKFKRAIQHE